MLLRRARADDWAPMKPRTPPSLPPRKSQPADSVGPTFSPITAGLRKAPADAPRLESPTNKRTPTPKAEVQMKYRCPGCGLDFAKWSPCLAHLREFGHVEAKELDKSLHADFRRVQEMCALFYTNRLSHRLLAAKGDTSSSDESDSEEVAQPRAPPTSGKKPRRRSRKFHLGALPEKVMFKINAFLDVDSATALFRAITHVSGGDKSVDESRVNRWSGSSQGSTSTTGHEGGGVRWSQGHLASAQLTEVVDTANMRWYAAFFVSPAWGAGKLTRPQ